MAAEYPLQVLVYTGWTHVAEPKDHDAGDLSATSCHQVAEVEIVNLQDTAFLTR
jgi:hypothetical protein